MQVNFENGKSCQFSLTGNFVVTKILLMYHLVSYITLCVIRIRNLKLENREKSLSSIGSVVRQRCRTSYEGRTAPKWTQYRLQCGKYIDWFRDVWSIYDPITPRTHYTNIERCDIFVVWGYTIVYYENIAWIRRWQQVGIVFTLVWLVTPKAQTHYNADFTHPWFLRNYLGKTVWYSRDKTVLMWTESLFHLLLVDIF